MKATVEFDISKLNSDDLDFYCALDEKKKAVFEKQWVDLELQKLKTKQKMAKLNKMKNAQKEAQRKARTHHLIEVGAMVEQYFGTIEDLSMLEKYLQKYENGYKRFVENNSYNDFSASGSVNLGLLNH